MPELEPPFVWELFVSMPIVDPSHFSPTISVLMEALLALAGARDKPTEFADGPFDLVLAPNSL